MPSDENLEVVEPSPDMEGVQRVVVEKRIQARIQVDIPIIVEIDSGRYDCRLEDVSIDGAGAYVTSGTVRVELGKHVRLVLPEREVSGTAGVRRVDEDGKGFGLEFDDATIGAIVAGWARGVG